jgi:DNA-binding NtrC family response regulator
MKPRVTALLVNDRDEPLEMLKFVLEGLSVEILRVRTCREAKARLGETAPPHLVLTDTVLPDGNWLDVLESAAKAREQVNVVVASRVADIGLYLDVMHHGAFDFVTDSFTAPELVHVLRCAVDNAVESRGAGKSFSAARQKGQRREVII